MSYGGFYKLQCPARLERELAQPSVRMGEFGGGHYVATGTRTGEDPPHESDWWISTDDARDYARWVGIRAEDLDRAYERWKGNPATVEAAVSWGGETKWLAWIDEWRSYLLSIEANWWARVNSWHTTEQRHKELREFAKRASALGLPGVPDVGELPKSPVDQATDSLGSGAAAATSLAGALGLVLIGGAALLAVREIRK